MRWLRRPLRKILSLVLMALAVVAVLIAMFRFAAVEREVLPAHEAAGQGATFATVGDQKVHYTQWGSAGGRTILLVPGTLAWSQTFSDIASPLAGLGYRVVAVDLPPFGFTQRPFGHDYSRAAQAERILAFADAMGIEDFVLGVHSYGGGAAVEAAFEAPERIDGLVLLDVALGIGNPPGGSVFTWVLGFDTVRETLVASTFTNPVATGLGLKAFLYDDSLVTRERLDLYRKPLTLRGTTEAIGRWLQTGLFRDESRAASSDPARFRAFQPPVLVLWGKQDTVTPLAQGEAIAALFPNARLEALDGVNHIPHVEKPGEVVRLVDAFVRGLPARAPGPDDDKEDRLPAAPPADATPADPAVPADPVPPSP
ncbi:MAG: alpha/beta hydrolase [Rhizobiaceae bacterium]|nr:alpha/beta hydrolase [Rhizobiaceae bacterium]